MTRSAHPPEGESRTLERGEQMRWVVWGVGQPPDIEGAEPASDVAMRMAAEKDPRWARRADRWAVIVLGTESEVDTLVSDTAEAAGYTEFLTPGRDEEMPSEPMKGTLRSDVAPRRKAEPR